MFTRAAMGALASALAVVALAAGCNTTPFKTPINQHAAIYRTLEEWRQGLEAKDSAAVVATLSDEFLSRRFGTKLDYKTTLERYCSDGTLDNVEVVIEPTGTTIENGIATVYPVRVKLASGAYDLAVHLRREEESIWRIIGMDTK